MPIGNESHILKQFSELGLAEPILRAVSGEGYTNPTPIQAEVVPAMLAGHDIVGIAQTGTGKTAAFVLPLLNAVLTDKRRADPKTCKALILVPTRELAKQVSDSIRTYGRHMRVSQAIVVGGVKPSPQVRALAQGVDIVIATPGRLEDHMRSGAIRLDRTGVAVLDEADQMLDLGFIPAIRRILAKVPATRQTVLLSATMPKAIRALASDFLSSPVEIAVTPASKPIEKIDQSVRFVNAGAKRDMLASVLGGAEVERAIVFTRTKHGADKVCRFLENAGLRSAALHGNKSQGQREKALGAFRDGKVKVLVATDIAARGIDIDGVSHVVNYELPNVPEAYVHRIGRTARAGASGVAIAFCDSSERPLLRDIERLTGQKLEVVGEDNLPAEEPKRAGNAQPRNRNRRRKWGAKPEIRNGETGAPRGEQRGRHSAEGAPRSPGGFKPKSRWQRSKRFANKGRAATSA
ncbi:MAG: DEAD/DEAH box helicase [Rhizobiaceae bacterium]|nr:DEAD/DEAH box helicase [Rhizobiaceae bacterium]